MSFWAACGMDSEWIHPSQKKENSTSFCFGNDARIKYATVFSSLTTTVHLGLGFHGDLTLCLFLFLTAQFCADLGTNSSQVLMLMIIIQCVHMGHAHVLNFSFNGHQGLGKGHSKFSNDDCPGDGPQAPRRSSQQ